MKVYSIGREVGCDIVINDNSDVISRRHATLNVASSGKMTIVDLSHNGTYVNGIRISPNVPVPVTRKDNVSFAHVARLDWNLIPNTGATIIKWVALGVLAVLLVIGGVWGFKALSTKETSDVSGGGASYSAPVDSAALKREKEKIAEQEKRKQDSIKKHVQDSLSKVKAKNGNIKKPVPKPEPKPKPEPPKKEEKKTRVRG